MKQSHRRIAPEAERILWAKAKRHVRRPGALTQDSKQRTLAALMEACSATDPDA